MKPINKTTPGVLRFGFWSTKITLNLFSLFTLLQWSVWRSLCYRTDCLLIMRDSFFVVPAAYWHSLYDISMLEGHAPQLPLTSPSFPPSSSQRRRHTLLFGFSVVLILLFLFCCFVAPICRWSCVYTEWWRWWEQRLIGRERHSRLSKHRTLYVLSLTHQ